MPEGDFYDVGGLQQVGINLFHGWGYDFYGKANQLRADDQLVRSKAAGLLGTALAAVHAAESAYRREFLPPPSRAKPYPDAAAVAGAQALERLGRAIGAIEGRLHAQPAPGNDRMTQRHRQEGETLAALVQCDQLLVGQADLLRSILAGRDGAWMLDSLVLLDQGLEAIAATLRRREGLLAS